MRHVTVRRHRLAFLGAFLKRLGIRVWDSDVFGRAAQLSYFFLLAVFPAALFFVTLAGYLIGASKLGGDVLLFLGGVLPESAHSLVDKTLSEITMSPDAIKLSSSILLTLLTSSGGVAAIGEGLNVAHCRKETRSWWRTRVDAVLLIVVLSLLAVLIVIPAFFFSSAPWVRWGAGTLLLLLDSLVVYRYSSGPFDRDWHHIWPGAFTAVGLILLVSAGFRTYLGFFDHYSLVYGSLGAVIVLTLWFYLAGVAILIGGHVNAELMAAGVT